MKNTKLVAAIALGLAAGISAKASYSIAASDASEATPGSGSLTLNLANIYDSSHVSVIPPGTGTFTLGTLSNPTGAASPVTPTASGTFSDWAESTFVNGVASSSFTSTQLSNGEVTELITFTLTGASVGDEYVIKAGSTITGSAPFTSGGIVLYGGKSAYFTVDVTAAPEPAQTLAGAMLLGFGGLVFAGRRFFKKQSA